MIPGLEPKLPQLATGSVLWRVLAVEVVEGAVPVLEVAVEGVEVGIAKTLAGLSPRVRLALIPLAPLEQATQIARPPTTAPMAAPPL